MLRRSIIATLIAVVSVVSLAGTAGAGGYPPPGINAEVLGDGSVRVTGSGCEPGSAVSGVVTDSSGAAVDTVDATADDQGQFEMVVTGLAPGQYNITATCGDLVQVAGVTVGADCSASISASPSSAAIGDSVTVTASCNGAGEDVAFTLFSDPIALGTATADADGTAVISFKVPAGIALGLHRIEAVSASLTQSVNLTVVAAGASAGSELPRTGDDSTFPLARVGLVLLAGGGLALFAARRRSRVTGV